MITNSATSTISDTRTGYGLVSRSLHWLMAALFIWQFTSALLHALLPDTPVGRFFWSLITRSGSRSAFWRSCVEHGVW